MSADPQVYLKGQPTDLPEVAEEHVMPVSTYLKVFGALMVLTVLTVWVSYLGLGSAALGVAMLIALIKAGAVVGYFMHLKFDTRFLTFVFTSSLLFVGIFFALTFVDLKTRTNVNSEWGTNVLVHIQGKDKPPELVDPKPISTPTPAAAPAGDAPAEH